MAGLVRPSTSSLPRNRKDVDARDKPGHDEPIAIALIPRSPADTVPRVFTPPRETDSANGCPA